jgi:hypothetical protein
MGISTERDGANGEYEALQLPPARGQRGGRGVAMLRRRSPRASRRAVLYPHCLADSFVPEDLATWYTERGFDFYVADLRPQVRPGQLASGRRAAAGLGECFAALDAISGYLRDAEAIDTMVLSAHAAGALIAALWCDARRKAGPADALILAGPAFGHGRLGRPAERRRADGPGPSGLLAGAQRELRRGLDIGCPVLVVSTAANGDGPPDGHRRQRIWRRDGDRGTIRLGPHVTWLCLEPAVTGPLPPGGADGGPFFRELGRWLGAYLAGQFRDQLL